jgi:sulfotransferase
VTEKKYHFITGLPRSGSTMLSSILRQNPRFHASITDPLATFVKDTIETLMTVPGMKSEVPVERRKDIIRGFFDGYYKSIDSKAIFNTNRAWTYLTHIMSEVYPSSKYIVCVRDINWVLNSLEVAHRSNPFSPNTVSGGPEKSVYQRVDSFMTETGFVGFPYIGIKQAITGNERHKIILIEYDQLCKEPKQIIQSVYNFIGEPYYDHDFDNVESNWDEYDLEIGINLHRIKKKVEFTPRKFILPPDILQKYANMEVWRA